MPDLKTLAASLGLSITTVSRALDGYPDVSEATRQRVRAAADAVGYRPNASARRLRIRYRDRWLAGVLAGRKAPATPPKLARPSFSS